MLSKKINYSIFLKVALAILCFYLAIMVLWNVTNTNHKPTNLFWDIKKEGYSEYPLHDRKGVKAD